MSPLRATVMGGTAQDSDDLIENSPAGSLVPLSSGMGIVPGVQALRRGDVILYSVRGEPETVKELIGHLGRDGVREVVAFISHRAHDARDGEGSSPDVGGPPD
jgi:hypothetical protein